jgi:hypothetical protein
MIDIHKPEDWYTVGPKVVRENGGEGWIKRLLPE